MQRLKYVTPSCQKRCTPNSTAFVQDRYLYLPSFGWCLFIADAVTAFAAANVSLRKPVFIGTAALAGLYA